MQAGFAYERGGNVAGISIDGMAVFESDPSEIHDAHGYLRKQLSDCIGIDDWMQRGDFYRTDAMRHWVGGEHLVYRFPERMAGDL